MRTTVRLVILGAVLAGAGCQERKPVSGEEALARVDAALQINNLNARDEALATACRDAARAGAADAVQKGLKGMTNKTLRDQLAEDCAYKLRDAGQSAAALDAAKQIQHVAKRDAALKNLASGS